MIWINRTELPSVEAVSFCTTLLPAIGGSPCFPAVPSMGVVKLTLEVAKPVMPMVGDRDIYVENIS